MELECVKRYLENGNGGNSASTMDEMPSRFMEPLIFDGIRLDLIEPGRVLFSMKIPPRLLVRNTPHTHSLSLLLSFFPINNNSKFFYPSFLLQ